MWTLIHIVTHYRPSYPAGWVFEDDSFLKTARLSSASRRSSFNKARRRRQSDCRFIMDNQHLRVAVWKLQERLQSKQTLSDRQRALAFGADSHLRVQSIAQSRQQLLADQVRFLQNLLTVSTTKSQVVSGLGTKRCSRPLRHSGGSARSVPY